MNEKWPFTRQTISTPGNLVSPSINPMPSMPGEQFMRSIDPPAGSGTGGGGGNTTGDWPLKLVQVDTENVKVRLGTVSGFTPTNVNTDIDVSGTDGTWTFYLHATISGTSVTAVELVSDDTGGPVPSDDGNNSYRLVGYAEVASSVIVSVTDSLAWSQSVVTCTADSAPHVWQTGA